MESYRPKNMIRACSNCGRETGWIEAEYCMRCQKFNELAQPFLTIIKPPRRSANKKAVAWRYHLKRKYRMTEEEYDRLLQRQGGKCAVCGVLPNPRGRRLTVDYDNELSKVRGLLCTSCRVGISLLDRGHLKAAVNYLLSLRSETQECSDPKAE